MICRLCGKDHLERIAERTRDRADIGVVRCCSCGLVQGDASIEALDNYYRESFREDYQIVPADVEAAGYRQDAERRILQLASRRPLAGCRILDVGCGDGSFLNAATEVGARPSGVEPHEKTRQHLAAQGFNVRADLDEFASESFDMATCFHVLEHIPEPIPFLRQIGRIVAAGAPIFIEVPNVDDALLTLYRIPEFAAFNWQAAHLFYYSPATLEMAIAQSGAKSEIMQISRYGLANHLNWLRWRKPGDGAEFATVATPEMDRAYRERLAQQGLADTLWAEVRFPS